MSGFYTTRFRDGSRLRRFQSNQQIYIPPAGSWSFADLANPPKAWWDDLSSITNSGTTLLTWSDRSASGILMTANNSPDIVASGAGGKRSIDFNNSADRCTNSGTVAKDLFRNVTGMWVFGVYKCNDTVAGLRNLTYGSTPTSGAQRFGLMASIAAGARIPAIRGRKTDGAAVFELAATGALDTNLHLVYGFVNCLTGAGELWVDGSLNNSNATLVTGGGTNSSNTAAVDPLCIASTHTGTNPTLSEISRIALGTGTPHSTADIDRMFGEAAHRYGASANLPSGHPYKSSPP